MNVIQFITNSEGENTALVVDFKALLELKQSGQDVNEVFEDIEDILVFELTKNDPTRPFEEFEEELRGEEKLNA